MDNHEQRLSPQAAQDILRMQYDIACQLLEYHLTALDDDEYFWRPAPVGLQLSNEQGDWSADWPESEGYEIGPASISWLMWHIIYWWSMVLDHSFGAGMLQRDNIRCPANAKEAADRIAQLKKQWEASVARLSDHEWSDCSRTLWPFRGKPFYELSAWLNLELTKNVSEIGYCRFLYAALAGDRSRVQSR